MMNRHTDYIQLSDESQFAAFDMLSDLIYTISELESRGSVHLSHLNEIRKELTLSFTPTNHVKSLKCRPSVYESLIDKIDLVDLLDASQRADIESHYLQFVTKGCFVIPQIPPSPQITQEYINTWNEFFSCKDNTVIFRRGKRKKQVHSKFTPISKPTNTHRKTASKSGKSGNAQRRNPKHAKTAAKPTDIMPQSIIPKFNIPQIPSHIRLYDHYSPPIPLGNPFKFNSIGDRSALLEWTSTCGLTVEGIIQLQNWAVSKTPIPINTDYFIEIDKEPWQWRPPIELPSILKDNNNKTLDIPYMGHLFSNKMNITDVKELRKLRFGPYRMNYHFTTNTFQPNIYLKSDIHTIVTARREKFIKNMTLFYDALESLHLVHKNLNNLLAHIMDINNKKVIERAIALLSVFEEQYNAVFKENIIVKQFRFNDTKRMKAKKKLLTLASMIFATPPCDEYILSNIHGDLGSYIKYLKKSKLNRPSNSVVDFPQKSLIKKTCKENPIDTNIDQDNLSGLLVTFPTWLELYSLDIPCEIFNQHNAILGNSFLYNADLLLEQLITKSPFLSFTCL